jgi:hypothetical protein
MQKYCSSKGKKIMKAHLFDAASFLPPDEMKNSTYHCTEKSLSMD